MEYGYISSRKNDKIVYASKLSNKKFRNKEGLFYIEGAKLLEEAVLENLNVVRIFFTQSALDKYETLISKADKAELIMVTEEVFEKLTEETAPQGIFAIIKKPAPCSFSQKDLQNGGFLILEDLQNPLNIGAIFRCAYSLGTDKIVLTGGCADVYNPKVLRSAMGSIFKCKFLYCDDLHSFISKQISFGNRVITTALNEKSNLLGNFTFKKGDSIVIGNEGNGVKKETCEICDCSLIIPMMEGAESLNAATACSVVLWEMNKDKLIKITQKGEISNG